MTFAPEPQLKPIFEVLPDQLLPRKVAAAFLGVALQTMCNWATLDIGPVPRKPRGRVLYRAEDLRAWRDHGLREASR